MDEERAVLLNDLSLYRQRSGVAFYVAELLRHLPAAEQRIRIVPLSQTFAGAPLRFVSRLYETSRVAGERTGPSAGPIAPWKRVLAEAVRVAKKMGHGVLNRYLRVAGGLVRCPVYHEPDAVPLAIDAATVTTFHDLSVLLYPQWHPKHRVLKYERNLRAGIERTTLFLTDADSTKRDMTQRLGIAADRIQVIPLAPRPQFRVLPAAVVESVRRRLDLPARYLLFVGTIEPRKNVAGLVQAYARLPIGLRSQCPLVLVGGVGWKGGEVREMLTRAPWNESVRWLGYLPDDDLVAATNGAEALVYPSFYEGFGLPPLEAMACGRPVITTHAASLAEVVGDAALIVDPHDEIGLADAMERLLSDRDLQEEYRQRGNAHLLKFSWPETVRQTAAAYRRVA